METKNLLLNKARGNIFMFTKQAADVFDVNERTVRKWIASGKLDAVNVGTETNKIWLIRIKAL